MKKEKEEGKYIHASFIGKVSMRMKEYIKTPYGRKREKYTKLYIYPHKKKKKKVYIIKKFMLITFFFFYFYPKK